MKHFLRINFQNPFIYFFAKKINIRNKNKKNRNFFFIFGSTIFCVETCPERASSVA